MDLLQLSTVLKLPHITSALLRCLPLHVSNNATQSNNKQVVISMPPPLRMNAKFKLPSQNIVMDVNESRINPSHVWLPSSEGKNRSDGPKISPSFVTYLPHIPFNNIPIFTHEIANMLVFWIDVGRCLHAPTTSAPGQHII